MSQLLDPKAFNFIFIKKINKDFGTTILCNLAQERVWMERSKKSENNKSKTYKIYV